jgi:tight adherence protein C
MNAQHGMSSLLLLLRIGTVLLLALAFGLFTYAVASAPSRTATRLGLRGLKRQTAIRKNEGWAMIEPTVRWLGVRVGRVLTDDARAVLDQQISNAGDYLGLTPEEYLALSILSAGGGLLLGVVVGLGIGIGGTMAVIAATAFGAFLPYLQISGEATERLKNISRGLPYTIDLMSLSMGAGLDFPGAVRQVVEKSSNPDDPIVEEFTLVLQGLSLGRTRKDSLLEFAKRAPVDAVQEFVNALVQAEERGNPVAEVLAIQAGVSRQRRSTRAEEAAAKAGVQMVLPLMLVFFCVMGLLLGPALLTIMKGLGS